MAQTGSGYRTAGDLMMEMSYHLCQAAYQQSLSGAIAAGTGITATVPSTDMLYPSAQVVIDQGNVSLQEVVTVITVPSPTTFTANFAHAHASGATVAAATFPAQSGTDPLFTQSEVLGYLSRAQNELLAACPMILGILPLTIASGATITTLTSTTTPATVGGYNGGGYSASAGGTGGGQTAPTAIQAIEMHRIASSFANLAYTNLTRTSATLVTAAFPDPHTLIPGDEFSVLTSSDPSFLGGFTVAATPSPTTCTYTQNPNTAGNYGIGSFPSAPGAVSTGGLLGLWLRLYETSQTELSMTKPGWTQSHPTYLTYWYQDRTGLYGFGVDGIPATPFPAEVLVSLRDVDSLGPLDGFLVPDPMLHIVKYRALQYCFEKDGEFRDPARAQFCATRYQRGVAAIRRWLAWAGAAMGAASTLGDGVRSGS